jgi:hypothetical protein
LNPAQSDFKKRKKREEDGRAFVGKQIITSFHRSSQ